MIDKLWGWISGLFANMVKEALNALIADPLKLALKWYASAGALHDFFGQPWAQYLITYATTLGAAILTIRVLWEIFTVYILRSNGQTADVTGLVVRIGEAVAMVAGGPWFATRLLEFGNTLAADVAKAPFGLDLMSAQPTISSSATNTINAANGVFGVLMIGGGVWIAVIVLMILVYIQALIRSVEMLLAGIIAPVMAVGQLSPGGGTAAVWLREVLVLATSQAIQGTMLYLIAWFLTSSFAQNGDLTGPFFALAAAWVAFRTPTILRQYAYHTGVGGGAATVAQSVVRTVLAKLPA